jgi:Homeodomain-like domain
VIEIPPPAEIAYLTQCLGPEATLALIEACGGTRIYVPFNPAPDAPLSAKIGHDAAKALAGVFGGETLKVPSCKFLRARLLRARGHSYPQIALKLGVSETTVWRLVQPHPADTQLDLGI